MIMTLSFLVSVRGVENVDEVDVDQSDRVFLLMPESFDSICRPLQTEP